MILNNFPGGGRDMSETTLTPENARAGYFFFDANGNYGDGSISDYDGAAAVTPSTSEQVLATAGKYAPSNIAVEAIPSAYKRFEWVFQSAVTGDGTNVLTLPITMAGTTEQVEALITESQIFLSHFWSSSIDGSTSLALAFDTYWLMNLYKNSGETSTVQVCYCCRHSGYSGTTYYTQTLTGCTFTWDEESGSITLTLPADSNIVFMPALYTEAILADQ